MQRNMQIILLVTLLTAGARVSAQDSTDSRSSFGGGLTVQGGIGYFAVRDEYLSHDKYSSSIPLVGVTWSKYHETYAFRLHLEYQWTSNLKNRNVSAKMVQSRLALAYLYPLGEAGILSHKVFLSLGPTAGFFEHYRQEKIAGSEYLSSNVALISGGVRSEAFCPLNARLQLQAGAHLTLLSFGFRSVNSNISATSPTKLLTPFTGIDADGEVALSFRLIASWYLWAGYRFNMTRVTAWDFFLSANDNLLVSISYGL
jgi:hypothetical protein